jgi:hypothetical protein
MERQAAISFAICRPHSQLITTVSGATSYNRDFLPFLYRRQGLTTTRYSVCNKRLLEEAH